MTIEYPGIQHLLEYVLHEIWYCISYVVRTNRGHNNKRWALEDRATKARPGTNKYSSQL
jgi:hypothetical protein